MRRLEKIINRCKEQKRKALVMFTSMGYPDINTSQQLLESMAGNGADIIEIGVPFSDPMADGPVIQKASERALANGMSLRKALNMARKLRKKSDVGMVLFSYYNVLLAYGIEKLSKECAEIGIDGWLVVDLPHEHAGEVKEIINAHDLDFISLIAPTTPPERAARILAGAQGFVYCITVAGVTGARDHYAESPQEMLKNIKAASPVPVLAGFGISSPEMVREMSAECDGVVVGSALLKIFMKNHGDNETALSECGSFIRSLAAALR